jgi:hypothetical protein
MKFSLPKALLLLATCSGALVWSQENEMITDREVTLLHFADLEYPRLASQALIQGVVVVLAKLNDKGSVVDASALSGAQSLIPTCIENARKWRFMPNRKKEAVIVYSFWVDGTTLEPGCSRFAVEPPNFATITTCAHKIQ